MRTMSHDSFERSEAIQGSSNRTLGVTFGVVFLIIGLYPLVSGHSLRLWGVGVSVAFFLLPLRCPTRWAP